MRHANAKEFI